MLEHGKPHERTDIIRQLAGQIVKMSQEKFASNVIEKCLTFGSPEERQLLVNEMLGTSDENEPLQVCPLLSLILQILCFSEAGDYLLLKLFNASEFSINRRHLCSLYY